MRASLLTPWLVLRDDNYFASGDEEWPLCAGILVDAFPETTEALRVRFRVYPKRTKGATPIRFDAIGCALGRGLGRHGKYVLDWTRGALRRGLPADLRKRMDSGKCLWISVEVKK